MPGRHPLARPVPADFADHAHLTIKAICAHYRAGNAVVSRWIKEGGVERPRHVGGLPPRAVPADFAERQAGQSTYRLAEHYGVSREMVNRWLRETGLSRSRPVPRSDGRPKKSAHVGFVPPRNGPVDRPHLDNSRAGQAAEYLRRFGPVIRCNAAGEYDPRGDHWRRGSSKPLSADEIIERALRERWPDPLARFAARPTTQLQSGANA